MSGGRESTRRRYYERKLAGLCVRCPNAANQDAVVCQRCVNRQTENRRKLRQTYKAKGWCVDCSRTPIPGQTRCQRCKDRHEKGGHH